MDTVETTTKNTLINKARLADFVQEKRRILGMTQRQLANYLKQQYNAKFTYGTVCNLENPHNESTPNTKTLMVLAKLAGTDNIDIFLAFINNPSAKNISEVMDDVYEPDLNNPNYVLELFKGLSTKDQLEVFELISSLCVKKLSQLAEIHTQLTSADL